MASTAAQATPNLPGPSKLSHASTESSKSLRFPGVVQLLRAFIVKPRANAARKEEEEANARAAAAPEPQVRQLKVRIISWNMHDSLPKGNLAELLGEVPAYHPPPETEEPVFPELPDEPGHPYHIVVVAGQECPTISGLPMGMGAFKLIDREPKSLHPHPTRQKSYEDEPPLPVLTPYSLPPSQSGKQPASAQYTSGWSHILEDWFCRGVGSVQGVKPVLSENSSNSQSSGNPEPNEGASTASLTHTMTSKTLSVGWKTEDGMADVPTTPSSSSTPITGPYELLMKERLLGIYIAVFVHKELQPFVKGASRSTVKTGLIGGRLGNKGAAAISLNVDGTRLLLVNAHLAAHEENVATRLANLSRIKTELTNDSFLPPDDPKQVTEDISDRFDHTFVFGDLNFRLQLSRLHADWLVAKKDYEGALKFDQLSDIMEKGKDFIGFKEGPINFPPTYKFDVLRTIKRSKSKKRLSVLEKKRRISEEGDAESAIFPNNESVPNGINLNGNSADGSGHGNELPAEGASFVSSNVTDRDHPGNVTATDVDDDELSLAEQIDEDKPKTNPLLGIMAGLRRIPTALRKGRKARPSALRSPLDPNSPEATQSAPSLVADHAHIQPPDTAASPTPSQASHAEEEKKYATSLLSREPEQMHASMPSHSHSTSDLPIPVLNRATSMKNSTSPQKPTMSRSNTFKDSLSVETGNDGVYDTSSKKRVPSWCDRILWKTTVVLPPDDPEPDPTPIPLTRKVSMKMWLSNFSQLSRAPSLSRPGTADGVERGRTMSASLAPDSRDSTPEVRRHPLPPVQPGPPEIIVTAINKPSPTRPAGFAKLLRKTSVGSRKVRKSKTMDEQSPTFASLPPDLPMAEGTRTVDIAVVGQDSKGTSLEKDSERIAGITPTQLARRARRSDSDPPPPSRLPSPSLPSVAPAAVSRRWFSNFSNFAFLGRDTAVQPTTSIATDVAPPPKPPKHKRGEVVCLTYGTLDDVGMRNLEGRSDHRPIFGTYSVYI